jgi:hypothetical protein
MVRSVSSTSMSQHQISLLEHALREVSNIEPCGWDVIPPDLQRSFETRMGKDAWTGLPDLMTLREAALTVVLEAIAHTGEFAYDE